MFFAPQYFTTLACIQREIVCINFALQTKVGTFDGNVDGVEEGDSEGFADGNKDGCFDGCFEGISDGIEEWYADGASLGTSDGNSEGFAKENTPSSAQTLDKIFKPINPIIWILVFITVLNL